MANPARDGVEVGCNVTDARIALSFLLAFRQQARHRRGVGSRAHLTIRMKRLQQSEPDPKRRTARSLFLISLRWNQLTVGRLEIAMVKAMVFDEVVSHFAQGSIGRFDM